MPSEQTFFGTSWLLPQDEETFDGSTLTNFLVQLATAVTQNVVNVRLSPYNAQGDGVTDDTSVIQAALTAAGEATYGGTVFLPAGDYRVDSLEIPDTARVRLLGEGPGITTITQRTSISGSANLLENATGGAGIGPIVENMTLTGAADDSGGHTVYLQDVTGSIFRNLHLSTAGSAQALFRIFTGVTQVWCDNLRLTGGGAKHGLWFGRSLSGLTRPSEIWVSNFGSWGLSSGDGFDAGHAVFLDDVKHVRLTGGRLTGLECPAAAVQIQDGAWDVHFENFQATFQSSEAAVFVIDDSRGISMTDCVAGDAANATTALALSDVQTLHFERGVVTGTSVTVDSDCTDIHFRGTEIDDDVSITGSGATRDIVHCEGCVEVDDAGAYASAFGTLNEALIPTKSDSNRGAAGIAGRVIFNSDDGQLNVDDGTNWTLPDGTTT